MRGRLFPALAVSRSLGDEVGSLIGVSSEPEIIVYNVTPLRDCILLLVEIM